MSPTLAQRKTKAMLARVSDRRGLDRSPCWLSCTCNPITLRQRPSYIPARIRDVSTSGIGLVLTRSVPRGTFLAIHLPNEKAPLRARVVHTTLQRHHLGWVVGCKWSRSLTPEEVGTFVSGTAYISQPDN